MNEPSEKQVQFAVKIAGVLGICLPKEYTRQAYWKFINDNTAPYYAIAHSRYIDLLGNFPEDVF